MPLVLTRGELGTNLAGGLLGLALLIHPTPGLAGGESAVLAELVRLERGAWGAWQNHDGDRFRSLLLHDHLAIETQGLATRAQVVSVISGPTCEVRGFSLDQFDLRQPTPDVALIVYRARQDAICGGVPEPRQLLCSSLYVKGDGEWRSLFHQSTPQRSVETPKESQAMESRISIITLGVENLERSTAFYREGLGLPQREGSSDITFFTTTGTWLSLYARKKLAEDAQVDPAGTGFRGFTLAHNVRSREEVDHLMHQAAAAGARIVKQPREASWGGYSGYFQDPDGFLWEVAWNPHFWVE